MGATRALFLSPSPFPILTCGQRRHLGAQGRVWPPRRSPPSLSARAAVVEAWDEGERQGRRRRRREHRLRVAGRRREGGRQGDDHQAPAHGGGATGGAGQARAVEGRMAYMGGRKEQYMRTLMCPPSSLFSSCFFFFFFPRTHTRAHVRYYTSALRPSPRHPLYI